MRSTRFFIVGGAGFIGSHFTDRLLADQGVEKVTIFDNFSSGRLWHVEHHSQDPRFQIARGDVKKLDELKTAMAGHETVIHLASNPDIARAAKEPDVDFWEGTFLTQNVVEAMRMSGAKRILYASGSGVYGDLGEIEAHEDHGPMIPASTYGASKLSGEALISSYAKMFDLSGCAFRFGNVVGPRQTHGVGYDFVRRLLKNPKSLQILGNGLQSKSYIHVSDVVSAVLLAHEKTTKDFEAYNVATGDYITVREIAALAAEVVGLDPKQVDFSYSGGDRGWKGDVPIVRLNTDRIRSLGWRCGHSTAEAMKKSMSVLLDQAQKGLLPEA